MPRVKTSIIVNQELLEFAQSQTGGKYKNLSRFIESLIAEKMLAQATAHYNAAEYTMIHRSI